MRGWQLTFYTQQGRSHGTRSIAEWLLAEAKLLGISGATMSVAQGGYGRDGRLHWADFFELTGQPVEVAMTVSDEAAEASLPVPQLREYAFLYKNACGVRHHRRRISMPQWLAGACA